MLLFWEKEENQKEAGLGPYKKDFVRFVALNLPEMIILTNVLIVRLLSSSQ